MNTEFFSMTFSRQELREMYEAMKLRGMMEDELRHEKGLEPVGSRPMLDRIQGLLGISDGQIERTEDILEASLWEHAWYVFTDEWAWYRARQDVEKELRGQAISEDALQERMERKYNEEFERYVKEIEMKEVRKTV
jgi:hypothetical protein